MKIEKIEVYGMEAALRGARKPMNSESRFDSVLSHLDGVILGPNDLGLLKNLVRSSVSQPGERKFMRMIHVWGDFTLPLYMWSEVDTYKVSTVRNSQSTMHKLGSRPLTNEDFEGGTSLYTLFHLNKLGEEFRAVSKEGRTPILIEMKRMLPSNFLQCATLQFNYDTALNMIWSREHHRLPEWSAPGGIVLTLKAELPYMHDFYEAFKDGHSWEKKAFAAGWTPPQKTG